MKYSMYDDGRDYSNPYIRGTHPLAITCPGCKNVLIPGNSAENNLYSGGPFKCSGCNTDVTDVIYGRDKKETDDK